MYSQRYCGYVGSDMLVDISNRGQALDYAQRGWAVLHTTEGLMGLETDSRDRSIDDHIDELEDLGVI